MRIKESKLMTVSLVIALIVVYITCNNFSTSLDMITAGIGNNNIAHIALK